MKKALTISTVAVLGIFLFAKNKINEVEQIIKSFKIRVGNLEINTISSGKIQFTTDLYLKNTTNLAFSIQEQNFVRITNVKMFSMDGRLLLDADTDIRGIQVVPNGETVIENVVVESTFADAISEYFNNQFNGDYKVQLTINAVGKQWVV